MLKLDYTFMMADVVGERLGLSESELVAATDRVGAIHNELMAARETGTLPFYDLPLQGVDKIVSMADEIARRFDALVVLGIGGSALGTTAVARALLPLQHNLMSRAERAQRPRLLVLDNVDPAGINAALDTLDPKTTCFCVISKSGTTVETMSQFLVARNWVEKECGNTFREHFVLITDPEKGVLRQLADEQGYRSAEVPPGVGGRFSVFTAVGLLPLAAAGVDVKALLDGAAKIRPHLLDPDLSANPAYLNGLMQYLLYQKGANISVMMPYSDKMADIANWYKQLWAESLGKKNDLSGKEVWVGPTPVNALGATDQHSQLQLFMEGPFDKVITFVVPERFEQTPIPPAEDIPELEYLGGKCLSELLASEQRATAIALARAGRPNCTIRLDEVNASNVGALLFLFEVQTVFAGALFNIDPLDQPGVEAGKIITSAFMGRPDSEQEKDRVEDWEKRAKSKFLAIE